MNGRKPREIAYGVLRWMELGRGFVDERLPGELTGLSPADRALCQELVYGVIRCRAPLDWLIERRTGGRPQKTAVRDLLRLGLYQLLWLDRIPDHAAVFETVQLARQVGYGPQSGFVNALLRACARDRAVIRQQLEEMKTSDPPLGWSHPRWLVDRWWRRWGPAPCQQLLEWNNRPAELFARVNTLRIDPGRLLEQWRIEEEVEYEFCRGDWIPENLVFRLKLPRPLTELPSFRQGWFYVQDPSTLLAVQLLHPQPGEVLLDLCAAPGGKTTFLAQRLGNVGQVIAADTSPERLVRVEENCQRLGVTCARACLVSNLPTTLALGSADGILVDAPCSNTGVIRRRIELRWRVQAVEIDRLQEAQRALLGQSVRWLRPGGRIVYSTCSLEPEENGDVVQAFLRDHPDFALRSERELWPFRDRVDGAYAAVLQHRGSGSTASEATTG